MSFCHFYYFQAQVEIAEGNEGITSVNFDLVLGDNTGYFYMKNGQRLYVEYDEFSLLRSAPPVNFIIDDGAEMWASADFKVIGARNLAFKVILLQITYHKCSGIVCHFFVGRS